MQKNNSNKIAEYIDTLLTVYFKDMQQKTTLGDPSLEFAQDEVYNKICQSIQLHRKRKRVRWLMAAASVITLLAISTLLYNRWSVISNLITPVATLQKLSPKGQVTFFTLTDGTKIWLNSNSKLLYPEKFSKQQREVNLIGEAYFEVVHTDKPFIIHTGDVKTQVLGTSFNISAYQNDKNIRITVLTGKVGVTTTANIQTMYLTPNQQAVFNKEQQTFTQHNVAAEKEIVWQNNNRLIYKGEKLGKVLDEMRQRYHIKITADEHLLNCTISVDLNNKSTQEMMQILAEIMNGTCILKNGQYTLTGIGCQ